MGMKKGTKGLCGDNRGFTLLEVCIAMAVLAIALLGVTSMQINAVRNVAVGNFYSQANVVANQHIEYLKNIDLTDLDEDWDGRIDNNVAATMGTNAECPSIFTRRTRIFGPDDVPELADTKFCRLIQVRVSWSPGGAHGTTTRSINVSSLTRGEGI